MIYAIVNRLATSGSVSQVYAKGDLAEYPAPPYVVVADAGHTGQGQTNLHQFFVTPHFPKGHGWTLEQYLGEARGLLSNTTLTDASGAQATLETTGGEGPLIDNNDDGSISKELTFVAPGMVL